MILNFIGVGMIGVYAIGTILYWNDVYPGGIGLFGSMMTLPMAMVITFIIMIFSSLGSAVINILWVAVAIWFMSR